MGCGADLVRGLNSNSGGRTGYFRGVIGGLRSGGFQGPSGVSGPSFISQDERFQRLSKGKPSGRIAEPTRSKPPIVVQYADCD